MKYMMNFDEFRQLLKDKASKNEEKQEFEKFFTNLRSEKHLLTYDEWKDEGRHEFLFLTYDLHGASPADYNDLETFLADAPFYFSRYLNGDRLTNNSFVAFPNPLNYQVMVNYEQQLNNFLSILVNKHELYLNITSEYRLTP